MARDSGVPREGAATASPQAHLIEKGWSVYDSLDRPVGNVTDVEGGVLRVDGRAAGFDFFEVPLDGVRRAGDGDVKLTRPMEEIVPGARPASRQATATTDTPGSTPDETMHRPAGRTGGTGATTGGTHTETARDDLGGASYTASGTPVGLGSNTPVGDEPTSYRRWDESVEESAWSTKRGWLLALVAGLAGAAGLIWWRRRQARRTPLQRVSDAFARAGDSVEPVIDAARERHPAWLLAPLAALPLLYWLRSAGEESMLERQRERLPDRDTWVDWLSSLGLTGEGARHVGDTLSDRATALKDRVGSTSLPKPEVETSSWLWVGGIAALLAAAVAAWRGGRSATAPGTNRRLRDIMTAGAQVIRPDASVFEAASLMRQLGVGSLPVCDGRRMRGMVTDRDVVVRALADGRDPHLTNVSDVMTSDLVYAFDDDSVSKGARLMREHQIRRLPIVDRDKNLVGIVSLGDLAVEAGRDELSGETLEKISEPANPHR